VRVQIIDPLANLSATKAIWRPLAESCASSYFLSWAWIENWLLTLPHEAGLRLIVLDGGEAACFIGRRRLLRNGCVPSRALFLNATGWPEFDEIVIEHNGWLARDPAAWPLPRLLDQLVEHLPGGWDELVLDAVDSHLLASEPALPNRLVRRRTYPCPVVDLAKVRVAKDGYLSLLGRDTRAQINRARKLYEGRGRVTIEVATELDRARAIFAELVALHAQSWTARGQAGAFALPYMQKFHARLIERRFDRDEIQLARVHAGDKTIGCLYTFVHRGAVSFYQSGLAYENDNKAKPGLVCHAELVRHNAESGRLVYDFLGGSSRYKASLSTESRELVSATLQRPRPQFVVEDQLRKLRDRCRNVRWPWSRGP
jgi:CelD/BcsL family acetyltransferase involved in cellulose biosynthesis